MSEQEDEQSFVANIIMDGQIHAFSFEISHKNPHSSTIVIPTALLPKDMPRRGHSLKIADIPAMLRSGENPVLKGLVEQAIFWTMEQCIERPSPDAAVFLARVFLDLSNEPNEKAHALLDLGAMFEERTDFMEAVRYYTEACAIRPTLPRWWYYSNNNLAYSLNQLGLYAEAEPYCREAIKTAPERYNAHKNLGVSLQGQGKWTEAACSFTRAIEAEPSDPRAARHLETLLKEHPEIRK